MYSFLILFSDSTGALLVINTLHGITMSPIKRSNGVTSSMIGGWKFIEVDEDEDKKDEA